MGLCKWQLCENSSFLTIFNKQFGKFSESCVHVQLTEKKINLKNKFRDRIARHDYEKYGSSI